MTEDTHDSGDHMEAAAPSSVEGSEDSSGYESQVEQKSVPLEALQAERTQRQQLQDELKMMKDNLALLQSQMSRPQQEPPKDELDRLSDDDVLTVGEAKKFISKMSNQYRMSIDELRMTQKYPDYQEVITKYLPEVIKQKPSLAETLQKTQDYELAYYLATNSDSYRAEMKKSKRSADAERILQNAEQPGSLSSVGQGSPISQAKRYRDMSDAEFKKLVNRNLGYC